MIGTWSSLRVIGMFVGRHLFNCEVFECIKSFCLSRENNHLISYNASVKLPKSTTRQLDIWWDGAIFRCNIMERKIGKDKSDLYQERFSILEKYYIQGITYKICLMFITSSNQSLVFEPLKPLRLQYQCLIFTNQYREFTTSIIALNI